MKRVDLNVDIGEGFPHDEALLEFATSANICCGEHAGSWDLTTQTIDMCLRKGIRIGCHPGFPDRENFGRRIPSRDESAFYLDSLGKQVKEFYAYQEAAYVKPHGALYNILCAPGPGVDNVDEGIYGGCGGVFIGLTLVSRPQLSYMLLPTSRLGKALRLMLNATIYREGFADRRYRPDGTLVTRTEPGAVLEDPQEIAEQVRRIAPTVDSICLHGDSPNCLHFAQLVNKTLVDAGYEVGF
jgi:UPF0271 protein